MGKVMSFIVNKGGVGKTTLVVELASCIHVKYPEKRVLILDGDAQGNCSVAFGYNPRELEITLYDCVVDDVPAKEAIISVRQNLDLLPGNKDMNYFELDVLPHLNGRNPFGFFEKVVNQVRDEYDYILIDSPPDLKTVAINIIKAADHLYIPFRPEKYSVEGLLSVLEVVDEARKKIGAHATVEGIIANMVKVNTKLHSNYMLSASVFCQRENIRLFETRIPETIRFADAIAKYGMPHVLADPKGKHSKIYFDLLEEILNNGKR
ncbi:ParA family protein [Thermoactinomyces sp. CICC 10520]|uniref:ParA family protein n=1 Tax=Thermoactinomyces sp. CICC 10520 TaxID=2767433 RepID=UPI0018DE5BDD|nr:ParA family protein [Thermoactinomyces sp. CICC 10520]MBH8587084.1 ParA family protein [Thermoactinomyces sp. CICC 10520]